MISRKLSVAVTLALIPVLRGAHKHLDEVVVQAIEELALEGPLELRVVEVARMHHEVVGVDRHCRVPKLNDDFDGFAALARVKVKQRMLIKLQLVANALEAR